MSSPLLANKHYDEASVFVPESLLREGRRQKGLNNGVVPDVCVLDPDGDIVRQAKVGDRTIRDPDATIRSCIAWPMTTSNSAWCRARSELRSLSSLLSN